MGTESMNLEWAVFWQAFLHQMLPYKPETTRMAMEYFGGFDMNHITLYALSGAFMALVLLYGIGQLLALPLKHQRPERYANLQQMLRYPALILPLFASTPVGFAILLGCGIMRLPPVIILPIGMAGLMLAYLL